MPLSNPLKRGDVKLLFLFVAYLPELAVNSNKKNVVLTFDKLEVIKILC